VKTMTLAFMAAPIFVSALSLAAEPNSAVPSSAPTFATPAVAPLAAPPAKAPDAAHPATAAAAATPTQPATVAAKLDTEASAKQAKTLGYTPRLRDGKTVYCKRDASIGTRLESLKCLTEDQMTAMWKRHVENQDSVAAMQRTELYEENRN